MVVSETPRTTTRIHDVTWLVPYVVNALELSIRLFHDDLTATGSLMHTDSTLERIRTNSFSTRSVGREDISSP